MCTSQANQKHVTVLNGNLPVPEFSVQRSKEPGFTERISAVVYTGLENRVACRRGVDATVLDAGT